MSRLATLFLLIAPAMALAADQAEAPPEPEPELEHQREVRTAWAWFGSGVALTSGGLATMIAGRGQGGEINTEPAAVAEARSVIGAALCITGITTTLVGTVKLEQAWDGRGGRQTALSLSPSASPTTTGLVLTIRR
jgi:hypothetical protein